MGIVIRTHPEPGLLRVHATGEFSLEGAESAFIEMLDVIAKHQTEKILLDGREVTGNPETIHRFLYGAFAASAVLNYIAAHRIPRAVQFAYVLQEPVLDPQRFGEMVAANRGMWIKVFDNLEDAVSWLGMAPTRT